MNLLDDFQPQMESDKHFLLSFSLQNSQLHLEFCFRKSNYLTRTLLDKI